MGEPAFAPEVRALCVRMWSDAEHLGARMAELICAGVPEYGEGEHVDTEEIARSCTDHVRYVLGVLAGLDVDLDDGRAILATRADQGVSYAAMLQAFRIGSRFLWESIVQHASAHERDALFLAAADIWAVSNDLATSATEVYRTAMEDRARRDGQYRGALVSAILDAESEDPELVNDAIEALGFDQDSDFVVVVAETPAPGAEGLPDVERVLRGSKVTSAWRLDRAQQVGVVALPVGFGIFDLAMVLEELAASRVGISWPFTRLERATHGRRQASAACAAASPASKEVVRFNERPLGVLLAECPDQARALATTVLGGVFEMSEEDRAVLLETGRAWMLAGRSTSAAARTLHEHRNTVRYRIRLLEEMTGRDLAEPENAIEVYVALECARVLGLG